LDILAKLDEKLKDWGASFTGFSDVSAKLPEKLKNFPYAISFGVHLSNAIVDEITDKPTYTYFHHYRTVNAFIDQISLRTMLFLQDKGFKAIAIPASQTVNDAEEIHLAIFPHKTAATLAGLGWIGKSGLFINKDYGPRVRLGTILTDMPLKINNNVLPQRCAVCKLCVEKCPAMAMTGNCWEEGCERSHIVDVKACSDYMTTKFKHIGRGAVCGICMSVCPYGKKSSAEL
jgi:Uncharacterized Fe-S protein